LTGGGFLSLALFHGEFLYKLLDYFGSNLCTLHQLTASVQDGFTETVNPQVLPQEEHRR
jgi:hypothetical protein